MTSKRVAAFAALIAAAALITGAAWQNAQACTRIFSNKGSFIVVARSMDWTTTEPSITVLPRGLRHDGGMVGPKEAISENPLKWTSEYGSVVTTIYGIGSADGINERGLAAHMLYFPPADYGARQPSKPGLQAALWAQYALE